MEKRRSLKRKSNLTSNATLLDVPDEREKDVFGFIVKACGGCTSLKGLKEKFSSLYEDFDDWISKEKKILAFYKKNGRITHIIPFLEDAIICTDHINEETRCERANCERFHVSKYYMNSFCKFGAMCKNGHTFTVGNNEEIKNKLGLNGFSDDEILTILKCRYPQVCPADDCESEVPDECPYLHICYRYIQGLCGDPSCKRGHSSNLEDPHNQWVLSVYDMEDCPKKRLELFKAVITLRRKPPQHSIQDEGNSTVGLHGQAPWKKKKGK